MDGTNLLRPPLSIPCFPRPAENNEPGSEAKRWVAPFAMNSTPKRRWYQFSLGALLIVMLVSCFGFAWIGYRMQRARDNRARMAAVEEAVAAIEKMGDAVTVKRKYEELRPQTWLEELFDDPGGDDDPVGVLQVTVVSFEDSDVTDAGLEHVKDLKSLRELDLWGCDVADAGLEHLKGLTRLEHLDLGFTNITDAGLEHLQRLTNLQYLDLFRTNVADAGLEHLQGMTHLQSLDLSYTNVNDAGLSHLKELTSLQSLQLDGTQVTDAGLEHLAGLTDLESRGLSATNVTDAGLLAHLKGLTNLEILFLGQTYLTGEANVNVNVTREGVAKLQQALPNCHISY